MRLLAFLWAEEHSCGRWATHKLDLKKISGVELTRCQLYGHCFLDVAI